MFRFPASQQEVTRVLAIWQKAENLPSIHISLNEFQSICNKITSVNIVHPFADWRPKLRKLRINWKFQMDPFSDCMEITTPVVVSCNIMLIFLHFLGSRGCSVETIDLVTDYRATRDWEAQEMSHHIIQGPSSWTDSIKSRLLLSNLGCCIFWNSTLDYLEVTVAVVVPYGGYTKLHVHQWSFH